MVREITLEDENFSPRRLTTNPNHLTTDVSEIDIENFTIFNALKKAAGDDQVDLQPYFEVTNEDASPGNKGSKMKLEEL